MPYPNDNQDEQVDAVEANTQATELNTKATLTSQGTTSNDLGKLAACVCGGLIAATCFVSYINPKFAESQTGLIFSAVAGGIFGAVNGQATRRQ